MNGCPISVGASVGFLRIGTIETDNDLTKFRQSVVDAGFTESDGFENWYHRQMKWGDQLAAVCYSHGIGREVLVKHFPEVFSFECFYEKIKEKPWPGFEDFLENNFLNEPVLQNHIDSGLKDYSSYYSLNNYWNIIKGSSWPISMPKTPEQINALSEQVVFELQDKFKCYARFRLAADEKFSEGQYNPYCNKFTISDQINFVIDHRLKNPKKVLEIGGGRGEIANLFSKLGVGCVSLEPEPSAEFLYDSTGKWFFGKNFQSAIPLPTTLGKYSEISDLSEFDTIIFCESIEHIPQKEFWDFWEKVCQDFHGLFIIVNWLFYHPILLQPPEHIFEIDDAVYDRLVRDSVCCVYRNGSHLVLKM